MTTGNPTAADLLANIRTTISDAERCIGIGVSPSSGTLLRHLRLAYSALNAGMAAATTVPDRETLAKVLFRMDYGWREDMTEWPDADDLAMGRGIFDPPPTVEQFKADYLRDADHVIAALSAPESGEPHEG